MKIILEMLNTIIQTLPPMPVNTYTYNHSPKQVNKHCEYNADLV